MNITITKRDLLLIFFTAVVATLAFIIYSNTISKSSSEEPSSALSEPIQSPDTEPLLDASEIFVPDTTNNDTTSANPSPQTEIDPTAIPAEIVTLKQIPSQPLPRGETSEDCKLLPEGLCGDPAYSPWNLVGCIGKQAPATTKLEFGDSSQPLKYIPCDPPSATTAWIIEPLNARARFGPGRTITDDPDERSFTKAWWVAYGRVNYGTEVEVLGCFADQTRPVWSRTTPLTAHFKEPLDVSSLNGWVLIRYKYEGGNPNDELYPKDGDYVYAWVHNITLSSTFTDFIPVCNSYAIK